MVIPIQNPGEQPDEARTFWHSGRLLMLVGFLRLLLHLLKKTREQHSPLEINSRRPIFRDLQSGFANGFDLLFHVVALSLSLPLSLSLSLFNFDVFFHPLCLALSSCPLVFGLLSLPAGPVVAQCPHFAFFKAQAHET